MPCLPLMRLSSVVRSRNLRSLSPPSFGRSPKVSDMGDDVQLAAFALVAILNILSSMIMSIAGVGDTMSLHILWELVVKLPGAAATMHSTPLGSNDVAIVVLQGYIRAVLVGPVMAWMNRGNKNSNKSAAERTSDSNEQPPEYDWELLVLLTAPQAFFGVLGVIVLKHASADELKASFAITMLVAAGVFALLKVRALRRKEEHRKSEPIEDNCGESSSTPTKKIFVPGLHDPDSGKIRGPSRICVLLFASAAGVTSALFGVPGVPILLCVLFYDLPAPLVKAVVPLSYLIPGILRVLYAMYLGLYATEMLPILTVAAVATVVGLLVGQRMAGPLHPLLYSAMVFAVLVLACLSMLPIGAAGLIAALVLSFAALYSVHVRTAATAVASGGEHQGDESAGAVMMTEDARICCASEFLVTP